MHTGPPSAIGLIAISDLYPLVYLHLAGALGASITCRYVTALLSSFSRAIYCRSKHLVMTVTVWCSLSPFGQFGGMKTSEVLSIMS